MSPQRLSFVLFACLLLCPLGFSLSGCGPQRGEDSVEVIPPPFDAEGALKGVISAGEVGSNAETLRDGFNEMKAEGNLIAEDLLKQLGQLEKLEGNPAAVKKKAQEMIDTL